MIRDLIEFIHGLDGAGDKASICEKVAERFVLIRDRSVFYRAEFAIRFSSAANQNFSNTVLSLSNLQKFDDRPFIVCLVTPDENYCYLANTTLLKKISHSSHQLRSNNIRGSFNGSDISRELDGIENNSANIERLYAIHEAIGFVANLDRLVEATNDIVPTGKKFEVDRDESEIILKSPERAAEFIKSDDFAVLHDELNARVRDFHNEILLAALIENVNVRGRVIEYLIAGEDEALRQNLVDALRTSKSLPPFKTENKLGDYRRDFDSYLTETDVKTKILILSSNPKAYNLDKILEFLSEPKTVFLFYFVGIDPGRKVAGVLTSMFESRLLSSTVTLRHWSGRNSRGVTQFEGPAIDSIIAEPGNYIDHAKATEFLQIILAL